MFHHVRFSRSLRISIAGLLAAAVAGFSGCESPLRPGDAVSSNASESLLVRNLMRDALHPDMFDATTVNGGIKEFAPVDSPGPGSTAAPVATEPAATKASLNVVSQIGLPQAALNMPEPVVKLTLQDAIFRAARHNLAIKVDAYNPGISETALIQAEAAFDPTVFGVSNWSNTNEPANPSPTTINGQSWQNQIGIRKLLPSGGTVSAFAQITYHDLPLAPGTPNARNYQSALNITLDQPLLRGFGTDVAQAGIYLAQRDLRISNVDFKKTVLQSIGTVEEDYYNLFLARTLVEINERLTIASQQTYNFIWDRQIIDATKESLNLALTFLYQREEALGIAQENYRRASDQLKADMNDPELPTSSNILIDPVDLPVTEPFTNDVREDMLRALQQRPEMEEARLKLEQADIVVQVAKNDLLPELDLTAGMQSNELDHSLERSFAHTISPAHFIDWNAGIQLSFPLGNRQAEANLVGDQLKRKQAIENMMDIAEAVIFDVKTQLHGLYTGYDDIQRLDKVRIAASATIEGNLELENIRPKTPEALETKLQEQQSLASAETALAQAIVNYNISLEKLERAKGTLLEFDHISLDRPPLPVINNHFNNWFLNGQTFMPYK